MFFIHNRVENIANIKAAIQRICPNVKCAVVHGRMEGNAVENVMFDFIQGDYDVLIATTIIESGLDIPNANTIFINDAHHSDYLNSISLEEEWGDRIKKHFVTFFHLL